MMNRRCVCVRDAISTISALSVMLVLPATSGCAAAPQAQAAMPRATGGSISPGNADEDRGIVLDRGRLVFEHGLEMRQSKDGIPYPLGHEDALTTGDRIRVWVETSEDAYLYLAFCARQRISVYPEQGGVRAQAGARILVPQGIAELVVDDDPGTEVLYVILSRDEISTADPQLARTLAAARQNNNSVDCGTSSTATPAGSPNGAGAASASVPSPAKVLIGPMVGTKPRSPTHATARHRDSEHEITSGSASSNKKRRPTAIDAVLPASAPRVPGRSRGFEPNLGNRAWKQHDATTRSGETLASGDDGIAVVRYTFAHPE